MEAAGDEGGAVDEPRALAVPGHPALASSTIVLHKATDAFPLVHEFIGTERYARMPTYTRDRMRVRMDDFVEFLSKAAQVLLLTHSITVLDGLVLLESVTTNSVVAQVQSRVLRVLPSHSFSTAPSISSAVARTLTLTPPHAWRWWLPRAGLSSCQAHRRAPRLLWPSRLMVIWLAHSLSAIHGCSRPNPCLALARSP